jgi:hypothetical protein
MGLREPVRRSGQGQKQASCLRTESSDTSYPAGEWPEQASCRRHRVLLTAASVGTMPMGRSGGSYRSGGYYRRSCSCCGVLLIEGVRLIHELYSHE